jgi:hypothetical protein
VVLVEPATAAVADNAGELPDAAGLDRSSIACRDPWSDSTRVRIDPGSALSLLRVEIEHGTIALSLGLVRRAPHPRASIPFAHEPILKTSTSEASQASTRGHRACFEVWMAPTGPLPDRPRRDRRSLARISGRVKRKRAWNQAFGSASARRAAAFGQVSGERWCGPIRSSQSTLDRVR